MPSRGTLPALSIKSVKMDNTSWLWKCKRFFKKILKAVTKRHFSLIPPLYKAVNRPVQGAEHAESPSFFGVFCGRLLTSVANGLPQPAAASVGVVDLLPPAPRSLIELFAVLAEYFFKPSISSSRSFPDGPPREKRGL
jgi:hypothetical protein